MNRKVQRSVARQSQVPIRRKDTVAKEKSKAEYSPRRLVFGLNRDTPVDKELERVGFKVITVLELPGLDDRLVHVQIDKGLSAFISVPSKEEIDTPIVKTKLQKKNIPRELFVATYDLCIPECVGVAMSYNDVDVFVLKDKTIIITSYLKSNFPIPILEYDIAIVHSEKTNQMLETITRRLERHVLGDCDAKLDALTDAYTELHDEVKKFLVNTDIVPDLIQNSQTIQEKYALISEIITSCDIAFQCTLKLKETKNLLQLASVKLETRSLESKLENLHL